MAALIMVSISRASIGIQVVSQNRRFRIAARSPRRRLNLTPTLSCVTRLTQYIPWHPLSKPVWSAHLIENLPAKKVDHEDSRPRPPHHYLVEPETGPRLRRRRRDRRDHPCADAERG